MNRPHVVLKTTQGNEVFRAIEKNGLDPRDFRWEESRSYSHYPYPADLLLFRPTGKAEAPEVFFAFGRDRLACSPGVDRLYEEWAAGDWREQTLQYLGAWLTNLKRESGPSLWESFPLSRLTAVPASCFTADEQAVLVTRLRELEQRLTALESLTQEQKRSVREEMRRIAGAAQRMDKAEWLRFALGCMLTIVVASGIPQSVGASLMRLTLSAFHGMVTAIPHYAPADRRAWHGSVRGSLR
jgi:hypothetical protein